MLPTLDSVGSIILICDMYGRKGVGRGRSLSHIENMLPTDGGKHIFELDLTRLDGVKGVEEGSRRGQ